MTGARLRVSLTLGDMPPEDAFWTDVAFSVAGMSVANLMDRLFPSSDADADAVRAGLDIRANPDLPEMYEVLRDLLGHWRAGRSRMTFRTPSGAVLEPSHPVSSCLTAGSAEGRSSAVGQSLRLVLEHRFDGLAAYEIEGGDREGFAVWMRACILVYFLDKHGFVLPVSPSDDLYRALLQIAGPLQERGLVEPSSAGNILEISDDGRAFIGELMAEAEAYIGAFDAFGDVAPPRGLRPVEFATGRGLDLRAQVFRKEGIDAYRTVFLLRLYDGSLDALRSEWRRRIPEDEFLNWVIEPALDYDCVDEDDLAEIMDAAVEYLDCVDRDS